MADAPTPIELTVRPAASETGITKQRPDRPGVSRTAGRTRQARSTSTQSEALTAGTAAPWTARRLSAVTAQQAPHPSDLGGLTMKVAGHRSAQFALTLKFSAPVPCRAMPSPGRHQAVAATTPMCHPCRYNDTDGTWVRFFWGDEHASGESQREAATTSLWQPRCQVCVVVATTSLGGSPEAGQMVTGG